MSGHGPSPYLRVRGTEGKLFDRGGVALRRRATEVLDWLDDAGALRRARLMIIVAHPDDEVIGIGSRLPSLTSSLFVHVTHGATPDGGRRHAEERMSELMAAVHTAGLRRDQLRPLGHDDQRASRVLVEITEELAGIIREEHPDAVFTHPYEGGHPDHDATAFAVHSACRLMDDPPPIIEMASYHQGPNGIRAGHFLPRNDRGRVTLRLSAAQRAIKRLLFDCFPSQAGMLKYFPTDRERFRVAADYDFTKPPHQGRLFYENFDWGIRFGWEWRVLAAEALAQLEVPA